MILPRKVNSPIALTVLVAFLTAGCIGPFTLSRGLGRWNAQVGNKWEAQLVFLGLVVLHAYQITGLIDLIILNPIAFWKAPNSGAMIDPAAEIPLGKNRHALLTFSENEESLRADLFEQGERIDSFRVTRNSDGSMSAENIDGKFFYQSHQVHTGIRQVNGRGGIGLFSYSPEMIDRPFLAAGGGGGLPSADASADGRATSGRS